MQKLGCGRTLNGGILCSKVGLTEPFIAIHTGTSARESPSPRQCSFKGSEGLDFLARADSVLGSYFDQLNWMEAMLYDRGALSRATTAYSI